MFTSTAGLVKKRHLSYPFILRGGDVIDHAVAVLTDSDYRGSCLGIYACTQQTQAVSPTLIRC